MNKESEYVIERYARRANINSDGRYSMLNSAAWQGVQERQRMIIHLLHKHTYKALNQLKVLEVGCGTGGNLLELLRIGFSPDNLEGNELLSDRAANARKNLPIACNIEQGDAMQMNYPDESFDIVYQSTVFSSLLDDSFQQELALSMWRWLKPGGGILWYDFTYNNPNNADVRGVPVKRIYQLFPQGSYDIRRVTLAPPISRRVCKLHYSLYTLFNAIPLLRTHVLCWIEKK
jgi:ubiquinone/menaquinone biosynthesis C-methylase UbiE